jgi:hypothetical protein
MHPHRGPCQRSVERGGQRGRLRVEQTDGTQPAHRRIAGSVVHERRDDDQTRTDVARLERCGSLSAHASARCLAAHEGALRVGEPDGRDVRPFGARPREGRVGAPAIARAAKSSEPGPDFGAASVLVEGALVGRFGAPRVAAFFEERAVEVLGIRIGSDEPPVYVATVGDARHRRRAAAARHEQRAHEADRKRRRKLGRLHGRQCFSAEPGAPRKLTVTIR